MNVLEKIPINIRNPHQLLNLIAQGYKSINKALMEYIDNSFDSADEFFGETSLYSRNVHVDLTIDRDNNSISILDNCNGMDLEKIKSLADSINDSSEKRRLSQKRPWVNGQFGLGAHAYRFFAQEIRVISKIEASRHVAISIDRDDSNANLIDPTTKIPTESGTLVRILDIDKTEMKRLNPLDLKRDIETYFEMLLNRNVTIKIHSDNNVLICERFDYSSLEGIPIERTIQSWRRGTAIVNVSKPEDGILVRLKVCKQKVDRPPFFSRKGRRINYISHMDSFIRKTEHRKKVWENYYLTGYIEVGNNLEPIITRDDFAGGKGKTAQRSGIYEEIVRIEDDIYKAIEEVNRNRSDETLRNLASVLTDLLSEIAKMEEMKIRYESLKGKSHEQPLIHVTMDPEGVDTFEIGGDGGTKQGVKPITTTAVPDEESNLMGRKKEHDKPGIRIEFSTLPISEGDRRTHYGDGTITIFTNHPDFANRVGHGDLEQIVITPRLANYLAAIISSEYKEIFYSQKKLEPDRKKVLDEQINFIFMFEEKLKNYINQPIDKIGLLPHAQS